MWAYRYGEISYTSAVSEGTIHAINADCTSTGEPILASGTSFRSLWHLYNLYAYDN